MYFYDFYSLDCLTKDEIIDGGGLVLENEDGTVSVYVQTTNGLIYQPLTKSCCEGLASVTTEDGVTPLYSFDIDKQQCRWTDGCNGDTKPFKVVLNPIGNDGAIFNTTEGRDELCTLRISFDYLFQIDCQDIWTRLREVNNTSGLDSETYELLLQLQSEQEKCQQEIESLITQLSALQNELESTPFVIQCANNIITEGGSSPNPKTPVKFTPVNKEVGGNLDIGFGTMVRKMPISVSTVSTYCLTDAGLSAWSTIIGINNYTTWFNSNGTDTTTYSCEHVNTLIAQDNGTGNLLGSCHVSLTTREEIWKEIVIIQNSIIQLEKRCEGITTQIEALLPDVPCSTVSEILESLNVSMTLDTVNSTTGVLETVYEQTLINIGEGNLAEYLNVNTPQTGFYSSGSTGKDCDGVWINLAQELLPSFPNSATTEVEALVQNSINSQWLHFETEITDQTLLDLIYNEKIKLSFLVKDCCVDFGIMVDRIKLTKNCSLIDNVEFNITKNPSFDMIRVIDNKKSWLANEEYERREFDLKFRDTQYDINNYKLAINSKELDLDINPANAIEQDVFCYIRDNNCVLECETENPCVTITTYSAYTCPSGYSLTPANDACFSSTTLGLATYLGDGPTIAAGNNSGNYGQFGAYFYTNETNNQALPLTRVGFATSTLEDQTGGTITITDSSDVSNSFWGSLNLTTNGRLNNAGLSASTYPDWVGFSHCIDIITGGTYYIGIAADNFCRFSIDGQLFLELDGNSDRNHKIWHVFPYDFTSGKHIIEMEGSNEPATIAAFAAEIYYPIDFATLTGATTTGDTGLIFSTADKIGGNYHLGPNFGYSCSTGFIPDLCENPPTCIEMSYTSSTISEISVTGTCTCGDNCNVDLKDMMSTPMSAITNADEFRLVISSELIDAKHWKTTQAYPTLRLIYERYLNSVGICDTVSSQFNYFSMMQFSELVGTYWVDLIEQVVPATAIWGSTYVYGNTIFDQQKYQYKKYSFLGCELPNIGGDVVSPSTGWTSDVEVIYEVIENHNYDNVSGSTTGITESVLTKYSDCIGAGVIQTNCGSEFIGTLNVMRTIVDPDESTDPKHKIFNAN